MEPSSGARRAGGTLVKTWWNPRGTFPQTTSDHPAALAEPVKPWQNSGGNLVEHSWNLPQTRPPQPSKKLLEPWWNPRGTLLQTTPDHPAGLVEPWRNPRETFLKPAALEEIGGTLVEPSWNLASNHPRPPRPCRTWWNPGGTLVEPWNRGGTLVEPWWNPGGTLVEPLVEPWWNLSSGSPRTTPEPIWAETPKLSAVGEKWGVIAKN